MDFFEKPLKYTNTQNNLIFEQFYIGDMIKVVYKNDSMYNIYKGYIGEIKYYRKGSTTARIFLYPKIQYTEINLPLDHFIKLN